MFRRVILPAALLGCVVLLGHPARAADLPPGDVRAAVGRSTAYLEMEGVAWVKKQGCASCHHVPMMVWALTSARQNGYPVNKTVLGEVTSWALAEKNHAQVFPDLPLDKSRTETDYLGPLLMALAAGANRDGDAATEKARVRLLTHAAGPQEKDGSWNANSGGRPPVHATRDVMTGWLLLVLTDRPARPGTPDPWKTQREAAAGWLARNPPADTTQAVAVRLLVAERLDKPAADIGPLRDSLLKLQNEDGGWSQAKAMTSDAYATGLALYALGGQSRNRVGVAIGRAHAFLLKSQQADGSWPMVSRPADPPGPGPAKNLGPIRYFGTAWATLGLVRTGPPAGGPK